jgi:hypothetical protein
MSKSVGGSGTSGMSSKAVGLSASERKKAIRTGDISVSAKEFSRWTAEEQEMWRTQRNKRADKVSKSNEEFRQWYERKYGVSGAKNSKNDPLSGLKNSNGGVGVNIGNIGSIVPLLIGGGLILSEEDKKKKKKSQN